MKLHRNRKNQRGVALLFALIALLLLTAIAATMIFSSNIESSVNSNYRAEQQAYFAARAGIEEARVRMLRPTQRQAQPLNTGDLCGGVGGLGAASNLNCPNLPQQVPGSGGVSNSDMIYIVNPGTVNASPAGAVEAVDPSAAGSAFFDDELCKEHYQNYGLAVAPAGQRCTAVPGATWYQTPSQKIVGLPNSRDPFTTTDRATSYKWVRIALKQNWSNNAYTVDGHLQSGADLSANPYSSICFDGVQEWVQASLPQGANGYNVLCQPSGTAKDKYRPVYQITSLAVTPSGARRLLQSEFADTPPIYTDASLDTQSLVNINGGSVTVNGYDNCKCDCTVAVGSHPPVCTVHGSNGAIACTAGTQAIYTTQTVSAGGAIVAPTNPTTLQNQTSFPYDIPTLISQYKSVANFTDPAGTSFGVPPWGSGQATTNGDPGAPNEFPCNHPNGDPTQYDFTPPTTFVAGSGQWCPEVTYFSGNQTFNGLSGAGVLVVDGDLTLHGGGGAFYGLIIVKGTLTISGNGCGQSCGLIGGVLTGTGTVAADNTDVIGGGVTIQYDTCALSYNQSLQPPKVVAMHELSY